MVSVALADFGLEPAETVIITSEMANETSFLPSLEALRCERRERRKRDIARRIAASLAADEATAAALIDDAARMAERRPD